MVSSPVFCIILCCSACGSVGSVCFLLSKREAESGSFLMVLPSASQGDSVNTFFTYIIANHTGLHNVGNSKKCCIKKGAQFSPLIFFFPQGCNFSLQYIIVITLQAFFPLCPLQINFIAYGCTLSLFISVNQQCCS